MKARLGLVSWILVLCLLMSALPGDVRPALSAPTHGLIASGQSPEAIARVSVAFAPAKLMAGEGAPVGPGAKGLEQLAVGKGRAVLSSSKGEHSSYMRPDGKMSIFTYHLIEALTGHARPEEGATDVLVSDAMSYVYRHVPKSAEQAWGEDQDPDFQVSGNFPVALLLGGKGWSKGLKAPDPLDKLPESGKERTTRRVDTGGGAYIGGGVQVSGGDFVGRDQIVHGDQVHGDKVGGDKLTVGNISGSDIAIGRDARVIHTEGMRGEELANLFATVCWQIDERPEDPDVDKEQLVDIVQRIEEEVPSGKRQGPRRSSTGCDSWAAWRQTSWRQRLLA